MMRQNLETVRGTFSRPLSQFRFWLLAPYSCPN